MKLTVQPGRYLMASCGPDERIVYDGQEERYHLITGTAAVLWDRIGKGGEFGPADLEPIHPESLRDAAVQLAQAGLLTLCGMEGPSIPRRAWIGRASRLTAAAAIPLVLSMPAPARGLAVSPGATGTSQDNSATNTTTTSNWMHRMFRRRFP